MSYAVMPQTDWQNIVDSVRAKTGKSDLLVSGNVASEIEALSGLESSVTEYNQINERVKAYLEAAEAAYTDSNFSVSVMPDYESYEYYDTPLGHSVESAKGSKFYLQNDTDGKGWAQSADSTTYTIYNVIPNEVSQYLVKASDGNLVSNGRIKPTGDVRMLRFLWDAKNSRDLGGWVCDGGTINYGKLFRGAVVGNDDYQKQNEAIAKHIGIKHEIDFRGDSESGNKTKSHFGSEVRYKRFTLNNYYADIINLSSSDATNIKAVFRNIFDNVAHGEPTYYHCSLGRDRCGTVTFMILALLGVSRKNIDIDYELSSFSSLNAWNNELLSAYRTRSDYQRMGTYLATLGGNNLRDNAVWWFLKSGFSMDEINAFRKVMINGAPEVLDINNYAITYGITQNLTYCTSNNSTTSVIEGSAYSATITANNGYELNSITVTMGGADITSTAVSGSAINIASVTGDIVITAIAVEQAPKYTNRLPLATDATGAIYNGIGYKNNTRLNSSGEETSANGLSTSGFIPCKLGDVVRLRGINHLTKGTTTDITNYRVWFYNSSYEIVSAYARLQGNSNEYVKMSAVTDEDGYLLQFTVAPIDNTMTTLEGTAYFRVVGDIFASDAIITVNEEIE